ncbi:hypothetical protein [Sphingomonas sp. AP4-R1]|jgi:hypothetical protein|uniref:hypothetical protein n=1 Tax=Sphingomonas sp. AP4-R1 TaxID=2735134 RepID=UPI001493A67B|nr:hypothetical protein [Sphingomonas sp. AP4-R1]
MNNATSAVVFDARLVHSVHPVSARDTVWRHRQAIDGQPPVYAAQVNWRYQLSSRLDAAEAARDLDLKIG